MKNILLIADTHGTLYQNMRKWGILEREVPDIIICMGDLNLNELRELKKYGDRRRIPVLGIPGNHEPKSYLEQAGITNIHGAVLEIDGVKIAGLGGCLRYKKDQELCMMSDPESVDETKKLPGADIFITHAPRKGKLFDSAHNGLKGITWYIKKRRPKYHFYGHIHQMDENFSRFRRTSELCVFQAALFDYEKNTVKWLF